MSWITWIIPPADATEQQLMKWRMVIAAGVIAAVLHIPFSWYHYASAGQVEDMNKRQLVQYVLMLDEELCNNPGSDAIRQQIAEALAEYVDLTGNPFPLPLRCTSGVPESSG